MIVAGRWCQTTSLCCPSTPARSCKPRRAPRAVGTCRASTGDREPKGGIDWDAEFRKAKSSFPKVESSKGRSSPRVRRDQIREQESFMLDIFSQENFFKVAGGLVLAILFVFVFVIGPPSGPPSSG